MLDTHAVARSLTAADFTPAQADALTDALREFIEQGDHVTLDQFKAGQAEVRTEFKAVRAEFKAGQAEVRTEFKAVRAEFKAGQAEVRTEIANLDTRLSNQISRIEGDMKLLKFGYGPVVLGLLIKLVFFP